jgi:hypothetical protein
VPTRCSPTTAWRQIPDPVVPQRRGRTDEPADL